MPAYNTWIVLIGTGLLGANAGLVGSFAVLRRRALTGDALAHAALPGLCAAFLIVGDRHMPALLAGALVSGLIGVALISGLRSVRRVKEDAAIGIVLSVFFGLGIALSRIVQSSTTTASKAGLDSYILGKTAGIIAQDVYLNAGIAALSLLTVLWLYKEFKLIVFDPGFAQAQGWPVTALDLGLMGLIALAVVFGLPMVGVVLMAALLILPGAAARFWTDRLGTLLILATVFGMFIGIGGTLLSTMRIGPASDPMLLPTGPTIVIVGATVFLVSVLGAPRRGVLARAIAHLRFRNELARSETLRTLYEQSRQGLDALSLEAFEGREGGSLRRLRGTLSDLADDGILEIDASGHILLTARGRSLGARLLRARQLWTRLIEEAPDQAAELSSEAGGSFTVAPPLRTLEELEARVDALEENRAPSQAD